MIISEISPKNNFKKLSFKGYSNNKDEHGDSVYNFNFPCDYKNNDVYLEVFSLKKDKNGNYAVDTQLENLNNNNNLLKIDKQGISVNFEDYGISNSEPFAYCYRIIPKKGERKGYRAVDSGTVINNGDKFNVIYQNGTKCNKGGSMLLLVPDSYNPGFVIEDSSVADDAEGAISENSAILNRARGKNVNRNFSNKFGGTIAGIISNLDKIANSGYTRIVSLPMFTDDSLSSHGYWIRNAMQISQGVGNINDYSRLQRKMFKNGINFVADGAFVNEGLEGIHFKDVLKWGEDSPYYGWFRAEKIKDGPLSMGVFSKNHEFIRHKLVNSPYDYQQNGNVYYSKPNKDYDPNKPTYIQIYDNRLATEAQQNDKKHLIKFYDKTNTNDIYEINTHNDTIINYAFEIDPETYKSNIENLNKYNDSHDKKINIDSFEGARFLSKGDNYKLDEKFESGVETWDANTDITKLNYMMSGADLKSMGKLSKADRDIAMQRMVENNYQVQDYAIASGKYWTNKTKNIITEYTASNLQNIDDPYDAYDEINKLIKDKKLPKNLKDKIDQKTVSNIIDGNYKLSIDKRPKSYNDNLLMGIMNLPLDSIEFGDSITSVLAYPYITNRATSKDTLGKSRFYLYKHDNPHLLNKYKSVYEQTDKMYTGSLAKFTDEIFKNVNKNLPEDAKLFNQDSATELGQYVLPMFGNDVAKFAIIKSLCPDLKYKVRNNGEIVYDYKSLKSLSLSDIGVDGSTPEQTASNLVSRINDGFKNISPADKAKLQEALKLRLDGVNVNSYKLAEYIVDKSNAGLDWRIDASKDMADIDSIRNHNSKFANVWTDLTKFWSKFNTGVLNANPNSYIAAEVTCIYDIHKDSNMKNTDTNLNKDIYDNGDVASQYFENESGMTTSANYSAFFGNIIKIFGKNFEKDDYNFFNTDDERGDKVYNQLVRSGYLSNSQLKSLVYSFTFIGNHDKTRALHCLALDMDLFFTDFSNTSDDKKKLAISILKNKPEKSISKSEIENFHFNTVSSKAIAMGSCMKERMNKAVDGLKLNAGEKQELKNRLGNAIATLASGKYKGNEFSPDAFGVKPFDQVIDSILQEVNYESKHGNGNIDDLPIEIQMKLYNKVLETTLNPAVSRLSSMMDFLVALPGNPTLFAGDELGSSGFEEKCKNIYLQCRNPLHWEWLSGDNKRFFKQKQNEFNDIMKLRAAKELEPLNNGAPFALKVQSAKSEGRNDAKIAGVLRQSTNGAMVVSLFNATGVTPDYLNEIKPQSVTMSEIDLSSSQDLKDGIRGGLTPGKIFYNYKNKNEKFVVSNDGYSIVKADGKSFDFNDRTLILYSEPEGKSFGVKTGNSSPAFSGRRVLYNPQFNFVSTPYSKPVLPEIGQKLQLLCK